MSEPSDAHALVRTVAPTLVRSPDLTDDEMNRMWRVAKALAASKFFKNVTQAEQAFAKMVIGRDFGLSPAQSMQGLYIVDGAVMVSYPMLGQFVRSTPGHDFRVAKHSDEECAITFLIDGEPVGTSTYTLRDAERAGLLGRETWKRHPRNMLYARCMSNGCKQIVPEVLGGLPVYVDDEIEPRQQSQQSGGVVDGWAEDVPDVVRAVALSPEDWEQVAATVARLNLEDDVKARALDALSEAEELAPGSYPPAKVELMLLGRSPEAVLTAIERVEVMNEALLAEALEADDDATAEDVPGE